MERAVLRRIPDSFDRAIIGAGGRPPEVALARLQHGSYREHLSGAGYEVDILDADEAHPDCVFVEDTAVVLDSMAVITRPGAPDRRGETAPVARLLGRGLSLARIEAPGTLDGGDVMMLGDSVYIGLSDRTNRSGADQLASLAVGEGRKVVMVPVEGVLHLKSGVLPVDEETVVVTPGTVDESLLGGLRIVYESEHERNRFSALPLRSGRVLVTEAAPSTAEALSRLGLDIAAIDVSEIQAANGGLTCLSILY